MDKLEKLQSAVGLVFMIVVIYIFYYHYNRDISNDIDANHDGVITKPELDYYIKKELDRRAKNPPQFKGILKSAMSGALRGALMGLLLNGIEGAIASALVLGMINPIIASVEHMY